MYRVMGLTPEQSLKGLLKESSFDINRLPVYDSIFYLVKKEM